MRKFKRGKRVLHQIGYWVRQPGTNAYTPTGYGKKLPGRYRKKMGGSQVARS